ncbi:MAG: type II/IV secretion system protein [Desulfobacteraceae bacterium]|nr:type II/IV secretion system protein [Desulfobacteraceae bacterium]
MSTIYVDLDNYLIDEKLIKLVPESLVRRYQLMPLFKIDDTLTLAMADPNNIFALDEVRLKTGCEVEAVVSTDIQVKTAINRYYGVKGSIKDIIEGFVEEASKPSGVKEAPAIKLLNLIMGQAIRDGASDIHLEPDEHSLRTRYRIDGLLHEVSSIPKDLQSAIISRVKVMGNMDISETRTPQDGRSQIKMEDKDIELRISSFPTIYGENLVLRILDQTAASKGLEDMGFSPKTLKNYKIIIRRPHGIILITGPTGSGKTTTLYASLNAINSPEKNIITIEDPVEYRLNLIRQTQINPKANITFASAIRSILRQDPDVIMVGEIRDLETAETAIRAASTGHLVFSTLHTNDAPGALTRLMDMGVEPYLTSSSVAGVLAQRLVRTICPKCKESYQPEEQAVKDLGLTRTKDLVFYRGKGCKNCWQTGYKGRTALFEFLVVTDPIRDLILQRASSRMIKDVARKTQGMKTLWKDGIDKILKGITTIDEINKATFGDES